METGETNYFALEGTDIKLEWKLHVNNMCVGTFHGQKVYCFIEQKYIDWIKTCREDMYHKILPEEMCEISSAMALSVNILASYYAFSDEMEMWYNLKWK